LEPSGGQRSRLIVGRLQDREAAQMAMRLVADLPVLRRITRRNKIIARVQPEVGDPGRAMHLTEALQGDLPGPDILRLKAGQQGSRLPWQTLKPGVWIIPERPEPLGGVIVLRGQPRPL